MTATVVNSSFVSWSGDRDENGHRTWNISCLVVTDTIEDGPAIVMQCAGLPQIGDTWNFGNDIDVWAFCLPYMKVSPAPGVKEGGGFYYWKVDQKFTTTPQWRCSTAQIEDPLSEPQQISGSFVKYTKEGVYDRYGLPMRSSSHEPFHGQQAEYDANRPTVKISQNVASLDLPTITSLVDNLNDSTLWGVSARCVKLSNVSWERKLYGTCYYYYTRNFEFDINFETFDRYIIDEGNKCLNGHWDKATGTYVVDNIGGSAPDPSNPLHFKQALDRAGQPIRMPLNGAGLPIDATGTGSGYQLHSLFFEYYPEANLLALGIPTSL
jgi:hypothetical protein